MEKRYEDTNVVSQPYSVLHVDSDMLMRKIFKKTFSAEFFHLDSAADGKEAFLFLEQKQYSYDVVITEMHMHFANGYEIVNRIRQEAPSCTVIITSSMSFLHIREGLDLIRENYFKKPLVVGKLMDRIKTILQPGENTGCDNSYELSSPATQLLASIFESNTFCTDSAKILKNKGGIIVEPLIVEPYGTEVDLKQDHWPLTGPDQELASEVTLIEQSGPKKISLETAPQPSQKPPSYMPDKRWW
ncbi:response regulator [Pedobacter suwonensis]|uniref:response regulator n=1 Tax=Pedobacter suwonensis TaxID=332999 RepID=UPI0011A679AA|nr:response regulator [Pedobacter suwonensis]